MPVDFLTDEQERTYARYDGDLLDQECAQYFFIHSEDATTWLQGRRGDHNRLGLMLQLGTLRYLGTFLADLGTIPEKIVRYVAHQLEIADPATCVQRYQNAEMRWDHVKELSETLGYRGFVDGDAVFPLTRLLYLRAWTSQDRPSELFTFAVDWLQQQKVLLPGITTLTRWIARIRDQVATRLWKEMTHTLTPVQCQQLEALLASSEESLDYLRTGQTRLTGPALTRALTRMEKVRALGMNTIDLSHIPPSRIKALATYALTSKTTTIAELTPDRRLATLLAFVSTMEGAACDDALDVLNGMMEEMIRSAQRTTRAERLRTLKDLDEAALTLADIHTEILGHPEWDATQIKTFLDNKQPLAHRAVERITEVARRPGDTYQTELRAKFRSVRTYLPQLLRTIDFTMTTAANDLKEALVFLRSAEGQKRVSFDHAPIAFVPAVWKKHVTPSGKSVDRHMYTLCFLTELHGGLRKREVSVPTSTRWADPRSKLLSPREWERTRSQMARSLQRSEEGHQEVTNWLQELDEAYRQMATQLPKGVTIETITDLQSDKSHDRVHVARLEAIPEPPSLVQLRATTKRRLPAVTLPNVLMEIEQRTRLATAFTHIGGMTSTMDDFPISLCAVLLAQACNLPLTAVAQRGVAPLEIDRLFYVQQNYLRPETIARANELLVQTHAAIPLATTWGGGEVASADGIRFVVPVRTINAGPNGKYFGQGRGITLINYTLNHFFGFNGAVVTGTVRDSLFVFDGLLHQDSSFFQPREIMTDTASYSDVVFGLFSLLGYRFSPRLADLPDTRMWRADMAADYGVVDGISRHKLDPALIEAQYDDILRAVASLKMGRVRPSELLRLLQGEGRPTTLGRAIAEVGRIAKTFYLLEYLSSEPYRRRILIQLNRGEARHRLARAIFYGRKGEIRQAYREGQEEQLGALGLVVNMLVLWNTVYLDRVLNDLRGRGGVMTLADVARLSPLEYEHVDIHGHYSFSLDEALLRGEYLPLRDESDSLFLVK